MKSQTLQKSSRVLSTILKISSFIMGGLSILLAIGIIVCMLLPVIIPHNEFQAAIEAAVAAGSSLSFAGGIIFFVCCLAMCICIFFALFYARRLFSCIGKGESPFTPNTSRQIRKIAVWLLLYTLIPMYPFDSLEVSSILLGLVFVLILFCVSLIFDYGCGLQKEVDETL